MDDSGSNKRFRSDSMGLYQAHVTTRELNFIREYLSEYLTVRRENYDDIAYCLIPLPLWEMFSVIIQKNWDGTTDEPVDKIEFFMEKHLIITDAKMKRRKYTLRIANVNDMRYNYITKTDNFWYEKHVKTLQTKISEIEYLNEAEFDYKIKTNLEAISALKTIKKAKAITQFKNEILIKLGNIYLETEEYIPKYSFERMSTLPSNYRKSLNFLCENFDLYSNYFNTLFKKRIQTRSDTAERVVLPLTIDKGVTLQELIFNTSRYKDGRLTENRFINYYDEIFRKDTDNGYLKYYFTINENASELEHFQVFDLYLNFYEAIFRRYFGDLNYFMYCLNIPLVLPAAQ